MKYKKKPVVVEAVQLIACERDDDGEAVEFPLFDKHPEWLVKAFKSGVIDTRKVHESDFVHLVIDTLEGEMLVSPCDYIIKEPFPTGDRKFYPCKPDIFEQTYELVQDDKQIESEVVDTCDVAIAKLKRNLAEKEKECKRLREALGDIVSAVENCR